mmetsp:Transcript_16796/g.35513  ORF Transcript_16796/g.35513 Transcript_16796/m.35513 type:complete len:217 (+) Transcript_16796:868-1518(+)
MPNLLQRKTQPQRLRRRRNHHLQGIFQRRNPKSHSLSVLLSGGRHPAPPTVVFLRTHRGGNRGHEGHYRKTRGAGRRRRRRILRRHPSRIGQRGGQTRILVGYLRPQECRSNHCRPLHHPRSHRRSAAGRKEGPQGRGKDPPFQYGCHLRRNASIGRKGIWMGQCQGGCQGETEECIGGELYRGREWRDCAGVAGAGGFVLQGWQFECWVDSKSVL